MLRRIDWQQKTRQQMLTGRADTRESGQRSAAAIALVALWSAGSEGALVADDLPATTCSHAATKTSHFTAFGRAEADVDLHDNLQSKAGEGIVTQPLSRAQTHQYARLAPGSKGQSAKGGSRSGNRLEADSDGLGSDWTPSMAKRKYSLSYTRREWRKANLVSI